MNNEPAFPWFHPVTKEDFSGLTKRELIAAMMAQGAITRFGFNMAPEGLSKMCVESADALLAELKKEAK